MMDPRFHSCESMPAQDRDEALRQKANALHDLACRIQDQLGGLGVFHGDGPLVMAKIAIDDACTRARAVADKVRWNDTFRARVAAKMVVG